MKINKIDLIKDLEKLVRNGKPAMALAHLRFILPLVIEENLTLYRVLENTLCEADGGDTSSFYSYVAGVLDGLNASKGS